MTWSPLAGGVLSGKYHSGNSGDGRYRDQAGEASGRGRLGERVDRIVDALGKIAGETGRSPAQVALNWLRYRHMPVIPIIGARRLAQLEANLASLEQQLTLDQIAALYEASAVELGFPYDDIFNRERIKGFVYGGMRDSILTDRAHGGASGDNVSKRENELLERAVTANIASADRSKRFARQNLILAICCMSLVITGMDVTIVNVALPAIQKDLHAQLAGLQWILDAYTVVVASFMVLAGSLSDRLGRRRVFQIGLGVFTLGSLLCSQAVTIEQLIGFRALQGLGASMLNPVALSIVANAFPDSRARARAVGVVSAVAGISLGIGPLIGGALTETIGWRSTFWVNVPIGAVTALMALRFVPESRAAHARGFDPVGQALLLGGLATLTYGVIEGPHAGWRSGLILGLFITSAAALVTFVVYEPRRNDPLLDLRFFHSVPFSSATILGLSSFSCFAGLLFLNALYLQQVRGFSAFYSGLFTLPVAVLMSVTAPLSGHLVGQYGVRTPLLISGTAFLASTLMLTELNPHTPVGWILTAYALFGVGLGMVNPAIANNAVAGMPLSQAGVAAAIASTSRQMGAALGVAVSGTVVAASRAHGTDFSASTHPIWWAMTASGAAVLVLGFLSGTRWAQGSTKKVAQLLAEDQ